MRTKQIMLKSFNILNDSSTQSESVSVDAFVFTSLANNDPSSEEEDDDDDDPPIESLSEERS